MTTFSKPGALRRPLARLACSLLLASALRAADPLIALTYSGDQSAVEALDREINAARNDAAKLAAIETRLLAQLRRGDLTFSAKQAIAQRLGLVLAQSAAPAKADRYKSLATMLVDERDSDLARLVLDRVPGAAIDQLLVDALAKSSGRARLGLLDTIARRRIAAAVPALTPLLKDNDAATSAATARALGAIADAAAVAALQSMPEPSPAPIVAAKLAAAPRMPAADALALLRDLEKNARDPAHRAAALRTSLELDRTNAATRTVEVLGGSDWTMKQVALEAIVTLPAPFTASFTAWDAPTRTAVIAALGRRGDTGAVPAIVQAVADKDAAVRAAALTALGFLPGNAEVAKLLAQTAAGSDANDAKLARQSLARLTGPGVNDAVRAGAERSDTTLRVVYLEQLALRNQADSVPLLLKMRGEADVAARSAALGALGDLATPAEQRALLDWTLAATDEAEQARALRAVVNATQRNPSATDRGAALYDAIERGTPDVALRLLPALSRIGGEASAACAARLAVRDDAKVSDAALGTLGRWTDRSALAPLATVAEKAARPAARKTATDSVLRSLERSRDPWTSDTTAVMSRLLVVTTDPAPRKRLIALLARANDSTALALAEKLKSDAATATEARDLPDIIRSNLAGPPALRASGAEAQLKNILDGKSATRWSVPADGDEWIQVDFHVARPLHTLTFDQTGREAEFPEHYEVYVTGDPKQPGTAIATGTGQSGKTVITLPAGTRGRYVIVKNTAARADVPWTICDLGVE